MSEPEYSGIVKEFRNITDYIIHEHDFIAIRTKKEQTSIIICSTCGSLYRENCGKLVTKPDENYMQHDIYN
ncbi:MAG: hypothetical protein ACJ72Q_16800 [Nitrososphaeraceae archaeon]